MSSSSHVTLGLLSVLLLAGALSPAGAIQSKVFEQSLSASRPEQVGADASQDATLDQTGYTAVLKSASNAKMIVFIERVANDLGLQVMYKEPLSRLATRYSGLLAEASFYYLASELLTLAAEDDSWLVEAYPSNEAWGETMDQALQEKKWTHNKSGKVLRYAAESMHFVLVKSNLANRTNIRSCSRSKVEAKEKKFLTSIRTLRRELISMAREESACATSAAFVAIDEVGYGLMKGVNQTDQMAQFVDRVLDAQGYKDCKRSPAFMKAETLDQMEESIRQTCGVLDGFYGSVHEIVGEHGVLQIARDGTNHSSHADTIMRQAGVVPRHFSASTPDNSSPDDLDAAAISADDKDAKEKCIAQSHDKLGFRAGQGGYGVPSEIARAITLSHKNALLFAQQRSLDWTLIMEDDTVAARPGIFSQEFRKIWKQVPASARFVRLGYCPIRHMEDEFYRKETYANGGEFRLVNISDLSETWDTHEDRLRGYAEGFGDWGPKWLGPIGQQNWTRTGNGGGDNAPTKKLEEVQAAEQYWDGGGCTTAYMVHKDVLPELLNIFPCCCAIDCCLGKYFFDTRGQEVAVNLDVWDSLYLFDKAARFNQAGIFIQDQRLTPSERVDESGNPFMSEEHRPTTSVLPSAQDVPIATSVDKEQDVPSATSGDKKEDGVVRYTSLGGVAVSEGNDVGPAKYDCDLACCEAYCTDGTKCKSFAWSSRDAKCFLKDAALAIGDLVISGSDFTTYAKGD